MKGIIKFLFSATIGLVYGLLFAKKTGKQFRTELSKSDTPAQTLFNELKDVDLNAWRAISNNCKNCEDLQKVLQSGKKEFQALTDGVKNLGGEAKDLTCKKLEEISKNAQAAIKDIKKKSKSAAQSAKKTATKKAKSLQKEVKTIAKKVTPSVDKTTKPKV